MIETSEITNEALRADNDLKEIRTITLRPDAKDITILKLGNNTHINYMSESHPNKSCIKVIEGDWRIINEIANILTLQEI